MIHNTRSRTDPAGIMKALALLVSIAMSAVAVPAAAYAAGTQTERAASVGGEVIKIRRSHPDDDGDRVFTVIKGTAASDTVSVVVVPVEDCCGWDMVLTFSVGSAPPEVVVRHPDCELTAPGTVHCQLDDIRAFLKKGDDVWAAGSTDDFPRNARESLELNGGRGRDRLDSGGATHSAFLEGGRGADELVTGFRLQGGAGADTIRGAHLSWGGSGADTILGTARVNRVVGGGGGDYIATRDGRDQLHGGRGSDQMVAGRGEDGVHGGRGRDLLRVNDSPASSDLADCGIGRDEAVRDRKDQLISCERSARS